MKRCPICGTVYFQESSGCPSLWPEKRREYLKSQGIDPDETSAGKHCRERASVRGNIGAQMDILVRDFDKGS